MFFKYILVFGLGELAVVVLCPLVGVYLLKKGNKNDRITEKQFWKDTRFGNMNYEES